MLRLVVILTIIIGRLQVVDCGSTSLPDPRSNIELRLSRPRFQCHFGRGFFDKENDALAEPVSKSSSYMTRNNNDQSRLQQAQKHLPYSNAGRTVGIIIGVPIYLLVRFVQLGWVMPFLRFLDILIARPIGIILDSFLFSIDVIFWLLVQGVLVPITKFLINAWNLLMIPLFLNFIYLPIRAFWDQIVLRLWMFLYETAIQPLFRGINGLLRMIIVQTKALFRLLATMLNTYVVVPLLVYFVKPFWQGIHRGYQIAAVNTEVYLVQPLVNFVLRPFWNGLCLIGHFIRNLILTIFFKVWRGVEFGINNMLIPVGRVVVVLPSLWFHQHILLPLWRVMQAVWWALIVTPVRMATEQLSLIQQWIRDWWLSSTILVIYMRTRDLILDFLVFVANEINNTQFALKDFLKSSNKSEDDESE